MKLYNSLSRQVEEVNPRQAGKIGMYTCGPTVYSTATIGNFRTYTLADALSRSLTYLGMEVKHVMNLTDVGHLTGDNQGDANQGEDRLEQAARGEGKTAWQIAQAYGDEFLQHMKLMNIKTPDVVCKATDHISEQIQMIKQLEEKGFTYKIDDGIYFDIAKFETMGFKYGELSTLDEVKVGARLEPNPAKRDPRDFALWKFSFSGGRSFDSAQDLALPRRQMEWDSPWGVGFPGWHIECSAMASKYLGPQFDIHVGGEDLRSTHHPNEIAQAEGATGKRPFVTTWVHGAFLLVDSGRMGKSLNNAYTVEDIVAKGFDPLALRYFYMTGHYRRQINFTWDALKAASIALAKLRGMYQTVSTDRAERTTISSEKLAKLERYQLEFRSALENDLNMPEALGVAWEVAKSNIPNTDKYELLAEFDQVLGLKLSTVRESAGEVSISPAVKDLIAQREKMRKARDYVQADQLRQEIEKLGYKLEDRGGVSQAIKLT